MLLIDFKLTWIY